MSRSYASEHRAFALPGATLQYGPDKIVDVERIDLHLEPDLDHESLTGVCTTTVRAYDEPVSRLVLDAVDLKIARVVIDRDGRESNVPFESKNGKLELRFDPVIAPRSSVTFSIGYALSKPRHGLFFIHPTQAHPEYIRHAWTQSQDENARYWFPCLDYPHEKQRTSTTVVVPKGSFALANGALVERRDEGEKTIFRYEQDVPHSTYLMTMVVGPFVEIEQRSAGARNVPVFYYVLPGREADGERSFGNTPRMIELFEERTGTPYPYERYSQIAVANFIFGGMENTSATTQTDRTLHDETAHLDFSSDPLVSHELAHQWFGDLLTCRDWSQAWLNEGFATFFEFVWREADLGHDEYLYDVFESTAAYFDEDSDRYRRPIVCNRYRDPIEIFDRHLYQKGAAVLHMLRGELGDARFWRAIRHYVERNAQRSVETIDLIRAIEESTGRNMRAYFDQWVFRGGHPVLEVSSEWDADRKTATVTIDQKQSVDAEHPAYRFGVDLVFVAKGGAERTVRAQIERAHETIVVHLDAEPSYIRFDPGAHLLAQVSYRFGPSASAGILLGDPDVTAKIRAARELAKDGSATAREALAAAFAGATFWGVLAETAAALGATRAPWARELLLAHADHAHPKVRRAVVAALGAFRDDQTAAALIAASEDASYFVRAAALASLGKTRDERAFGVLSAAAQLRTWNSTVEAGAIRGLAELADPRALPILREASEPRQDEGLRRAAAGALARFGELVESARTDVVDALATLLDDEMFLVQLSAIVATESLGDARLLPILDRLATSAFDGRSRRDAAEAAIRVREAARIPAQVSSLRSDLDELREEQRKLQEKIEALTRS